MSFFGVLTTVFVVLKLTAVIDWSWWLVLLPAYGPVALLLVFMIFIGAIVGEK